MFLNCICIWTSEKQVCIISVFSVSQLLVKLLNALDVHMPQRFHEANSSELKSA